MDCPICGPQPGDTIHTICHADPWDSLRKSGGCGHPLARHTAGMKCRECETECGVVARRRVETTPTDTMPLPRGRVAEQLTIGDLA